MAERLDIDVLRTLKAIRDHGGVTRAANKLALTQSAVSHKIRRFEHTLGCQLLRRKPGSELLTEDGEQLVNYAEKIISIHDEALRSINRPALTGDIRLGVTEEMVSAQLADVIGRFTRLYPGVRLRTRVEQSLVLDEQLNDGSLDLAVLQVFEHDITPQDRVLARDRLVWVSAEDYERPDMLALPLIAFDSNCFYRRWAERALAEQGPRLDVTLQCASNEGVCNAVLAGIGVALLAERHLRPGMRIVELVTPPPIAFVVRGHIESGQDHLQVLHDDICSSLSD